MRNDFMLVGQRRSFKLFGTLLQLFLLALALGLGQWLEKKKVDWLGEASVALLLGVAMGILSRIFTFSKTYVAWMGFQVSV